MNIEALVFFIIGYVLFVFIMNLIGISDIFTSPSSNSSVKNIKIHKDFLNGEKIHPDNESTALSLTKEELGRHSWALIHSIGASFPLEPNEKEREALKKFVESLSVIYPCKVCRDHFAKMLQNKIIPTKNRNTISKFFCNIHNEVNLRLGKENFDCNKMFDIWGGDCGCNVDDESNN